MLGHGPRQNSTGYSIPRSLPFLLLSLLIRQEEALFGEFLLFPDVVASSTSATAISFLGLDHFYE